MIAVEHFLQAAQSAQKVIAQVTHRMMESCNALQVDRIASHAHLARHSNPTSVSKQPVHGVAGEAKIKQAHVLESR
eukprot:COSAG02_NODE_3755_length_6279_cov_5.177832_3_plen_76_part_00